MKRLAPLAIALVILALVAGPVAAGRAGPVAPDVAEIEYFVFDECEHVLYWATTSEIIIEGYRIENHDANWYSPFYQASNYGSTRPASYALYGPMEGDLSGEFVLRVFFDYGMTVAEDIAERVCMWAAR